MRNRSIFRTRVIFLILTAIFTAGVVGFAGEARAFTGSYKQSVSVDGRNVTEVKISAKGDRVRAEFAGFMGGPPEIIIRNEEGVFRYIPTESLAIRMPGPADQVNLLNHFDRYREFLEENKAKKITSETCDGKPCDVYEFVDPVAGGQAKAWVFSETMFPFRLEVALEEGVQMVMEMSEILLNTEPEDALFVIPEGVQKKEMEDLLKELNQTALSETSPDETPAVPETSPEESLAAGTAN